MCVCVCVCVEKIVFLSVLKKSYIRGLVKDFLMVWHVFAVVGSIMVIGALTRCVLLLSVCGLKATPMYVQLGLIQELLLYEFEQGHNVAEHLLCERWMNNWSTIH